MNHAQKAAFFTQRHQSRIQRIFRTIAAFPLQIIIFARLHSAVTQPLRIVARHYQLHRAEKTADKFRFLVVDILADVLHHIHTRTLQFQHAQRQPVHIQHNIGAFVVRAFHRHLFGDGKIIVVRIAPVHQPHRLRLLARRRSDFHTVAQKLVHIFIGIVELAHPAHRCRLFQLVQRLGNQTVCNALLLQPRGQIGGADISVVLPVQAAQAAIAQRGKQIQHTVLRFAFGGVDGGWSGHGCSP